MVVKKFQINGVKITRRYICESKNKSFYFCPCPQEKISLRQKKIAYFTRAVFSIKSIFPLAERQRIMELKKWLKLNLRGHWSYVSINCTILPNFTVLVCVFLCHNLHSRMLQCEGFLTQLIFSLKSIACTSKLHERKPWPALFLTISPGTYQTEIFILTFIFSHFKKFELLPLINKKVFAVTNYGLSSKTYLATTFFKFIRYGYETFDNVN